MAQKCKNQSVEISPLSNQMNAVFKPPQSHNRYVYTTTEPAPAYEKNKGKILLAFKIMTAYKID